jgi:hypothetical protein
VYALPTRVEIQAGRPLTPLEIFDITATRETSLSRLLMLYISTGLIFMLLPGTFLGVWNLLSISSHRAADSVSPAWIQAHGHAQIFGWIGTFILGIGFYSIPKLRRSNAFALSAVWSSWALWTSGAALRWLTSVYQWHFVALVLLTAGCVLRVSSEILAYQGLAAFAWVWLPVSAVTEMTAVTVFAVNLLVTFARHSPSTSAYHSGLAPAAPTQS